MVFDFGYRLRELREERSLTQMQTAECLGLSKTVISGYENNVKTPSLAVLTKLATFYGVPSDYILGLENRRMLPLDGLTAPQETLVKALVEEFHKANQK